MKTLNINGEILKANQIIKNGNNIIGLDEQGKTVFEFKGIKNFDAFKCEGGFDNIDENNNDLSTRVSDLEEIVASLIGGLTSE